MSAAPAAMRAGTLNVSTAVTFVVAGCGVPVAKHGNRALSSRTGGADVLTALGVNVDVPLERLPDILRAADCAFLFAPRHHPSMRHAAGPRVELGTRTIFNLLGPLANPARVRRQLTGVFAPEWAAPMAETLGRLGSETRLDRARPGAGRADRRRREPGGRLAGRRGAPLHRRARRTPACRARPIEAIRGGDAALNAATLQALLQGATGPYRDTVLLNAAAALIVAGKAGDLREGVALAGRSIASGAALAALETLRRETAVALKDTMPDDRATSPAARRAGAHLRRHARGRWRDAKAETSLDALRREIAARGDAAARLRLGAEAGGRARAATA